MSLFFPVRCFWRDFGDLGDSGLFVLACWLILGYLAGLQANV